MANTSTEPEMMSGRQSRMLHALLRSERGATGDARHPVLTELVGREITSANQLTRDEAARAIDALTPKFDGSEPF